MTAHVLNEYAMVNVAGVAVHDMEVGEVFVSDSSGFTPSYACTVTIQAPKDCGGEEGGKQAAGQAVLSIPVFRDNTGQRSCVYCTALHCTAILS
jgi:hypothetical protein